MFSSFFRLFLIVNVNQDRVIRQNPGILPEVHPLLPSSVADHWIHP